MRVERIDSRTAMPFLIEKHYLHRKTSASHCFGLYENAELVGVVTFGTPPSRHLQKSLCPSDPSKVIELNRLWTSDHLPANTGSWFVSRAMKQLPPYLVASYADPKHGHYGYIYRALNFRYAGWTDMDRKTPRFDYIPLDPSKHSRDAYRNGYAGTVRRVPKVKYWTVTGNRAERRHLESIGGWPSLDWKTQPPPKYEPEKLTA